MAIINKLDNALINKIAAGEVIERPSSVVKELIENSIDAKATKIVIEIKESGFSLIKIVDNGKGMDKQDTKLCIERHATSKIKDADDIFKIKTLGFRGEALASIAAISNMKIITKQKEAKTAFQINIEAGRIYIEKEIGWQDGTTMEIKDLFFNVPARKKFLKNMRLEFQNIVDVISRYALINHNIFFKLVHNKRDIFVSPQAPDWKGTLINIYGMDVARDMLAIEYKNDIYSISGFISKPKLTRADKSHQSLYVNKRYIKNKYITQGVYDAYHTLLFNHRHPVIILNIEVDPSLIDVNVHPTKKEIRINKEEEMRAAVCSAIKEVLDKENLVPQDLDKQTRIVIDDIKYEREKFKKKEYVVPTNQQAELQTNYQSAYMKKLEEVTPKDTTRIIGQVHDCYLIVEDREGMLIVDQHAAEERVNYERFMDMYANKDIKIQQLLKPMHLEMNASDFTLLEANIEKFKAIGFDLDNFGHNSFILRSIPLLLNKLQSKEAILDLLDEVKTLKNFEEETLIQKACKASVKQGDSLTQNQLSNLMSELKQTKTPFTCPHGRPTMIKMTKAELERKFKRTG